MRYGTSSSIVKQENLHMERICKIHNIRQMYAEVFCGDNFRTCTSNRPSKGLKARGHNVASVWPWCHTHLTSCRQITSQYAHGVNSINIRIHIGVAYAPWSRVLKNVQGNHIHTSLATKWSSLVGTLFLSLIVPHIKHVIDSSLASKLVS